MTVYFNIPKLQQLIEEIERQEPAETAAARREYEKRLTEAWKKPYQPSSLAILIQSDVPIKDVAEALRRQCEPQQRKASRAANISAGGARIISSPILSSSAPSAAEETN